MNRSASPYIISERGRVRIGFLFLGGAHQVLHMAPVAAELRTSRSADVVVFAPADACDYVAGMLERFGADPGVTSLGTVAPLLGRAIRSASLSKLLSLLGSRDLFRGLDALVVAERTSTLLKRLPGAKPYLIHIPHGAGDRAKGFEQRIRLFDHVIVAGRKDRDRMIAEGLVGPDKCSVSGYIKRAAVKAMLRENGAPPLFENDKPTIFYNPHFDEKLSSWDRFADVLTASIKQDGRYNLVVAPHMRLRQRIGAGECARWAEWASGEGVIVDFGSERSCDMTYSLNSHIYIGDVSSQAYEFLDSPKPCVFLNATSREWQRDPSFSHWHLGEVTADPGAVIQAVDRAIANHPSIAEIQRAAVTDAFGPPEADAIRAAAECIFELAASRHAEVGGADLLPPEKLASFSNEHQFHL